MWFLPSRSRPQNIQRLISNLAGMTTLAIIFLDYDDPMLQGYWDLNWPLFWQTVKSDRMPLSEVYNNEFRLIPNLDWYGFLADDVVPETPDWDRLLVEAAGKDGLAFGDDGINGGSFATHFVLGGDLARSIGWLALPGLDRIYIDTVWNDIAVERGVRRYLPEVKLTHLHFSNRRALRDKTYNKYNKDRDKSLYEAWAMEYHNQEGRVS